jgi:TonB family protein
MKTALCILWLVLWKVGAQQVSGWIPTKAVSCEYPRLALQARISGMVRLRVTLDKDGQVGGVAAITGNPILASAARASLRQWAFAYVPLREQAAGDSPGTRSIDFVVLFKLVSLETPLNAPLFVYQYPNKATVSAVAPHWEP